MPRRREPLRPFDPGIPLGEATVQELQLELLRRNCADGLIVPQVFDSLIQHRELWVGALLDRHYIWQRAPRRLPLLLMIKLRDLWHDVWNADTLYVLCRGRESLDKLRAIAERDWGGEIRVHDDPTELSETLGASDEDYFILSAWWD